MAVAEIERALLRSTPSGVWELEGWSPRWARAGIADRYTDLTRLSAELSTGSRLVQAEQVHGAGIAVIERSQDIAQPIAGCDALVTGLAGTALVIRTADCVPLFFRDDSRGVVGLAHVGWRGLAAKLPLRLIAAFRHLYHSHPEDLRVAVGPCIRACCYEVGPEFAERFGPFVRLHDGRRVCDLVGVAVDQLRLGGIRAHQIADSHRCTACEAQHWFSIRREGQATGRLLSFIMLRYS